MTADDLPTLLNIERRSYPEPWTETHFRAEMEKPYSTQWVLTDDETDETIIGYVVFWTMEKAIEILNITVNPLWREQGFAKRLLRQVANHGLQNQCDRLMLDVRRPNLAAVQLYQSIGFAIQQIRRSFYTNGDDAYHMELPLVGERIDF